MNDATQPQTQSKSIQSALEIGAKLTALAATACIGLSVLFDWGYLSALGLSLSEVPTSLSDHTRSAILWLPVGCFIFPLALALSLFSGELDARDAREAKNRGEDFSVYAANEVKFASRYVAVMAVGFLSLWLVYGDRYRQFLIAAAFIIWVFVVKRVTPIIDGDWRYSYSLRLGLLIPPLIAGSIYSMGWNTGHASIAPDQSFGTLTIRGGTSVEKIRGNIVRPFEKFVVIIDENRKIILLKPDDIIRVEKVGRITANEGLLCEYWQLACPRPQTHTP